MGAMPNLLQRISGKWTTVLLVLLVVVVGYLALTPTSLEGSESALDKVGQLMAFTALAFSGYLGFPTNTHRPALRVAGLRWLD
jgi:hypothetical protein